MSIEAVIILIGLGGVFSLHRVETCVDLFGSLAAIGHEYCGGHVCYVILSGFGRHVNDNISAAASCVCVYDLMIFRDGYINARIVRKIIYKRF